MGARGFDALVVPVPIGRKVRPRTSRDVAREGEVAPSLVEKAHLASRRDDVSTDELEDVVEDGRHGEECGRVNGEVA